ncbi:hypothetical protein PsorP6_003592 [Peronosclerospora sorghi]|uniref:Uncharacterized protein n=1 Tax=Peronosclerospora sorghi TaxID=230839 RepID=A0ACC0VNP6_9STRA|nr:hypothetical protein PsorP6_003592 [Peronosclerospora sorghi]
MGHVPALAEGSLEAKVRKYLPKDYHVNSFLGIVMATLGAYATTFMFFKLKPFKKKEEVFDEWSKLPGKLKKWEKSFETLIN